MKTTGMSRRIDEAGRIVIPIEIRQLLGIKGGDPIEIFTHNNEIVLRKYDVLTGLNELVRRFNNEFSEVRNNMERETADKIYGHINALQDLLKSIGEGSDE